MGDGVVCVGQDGGRRGASAEHNDGCAAVTAAARLVAKCIVVQVVDVGL